MYRLSCVLAMSTISLQALSQGSQQSAGMSEHDGFFLSLSTGTVYAAIYDKLGSADLDAGGWGLGFDVRVGGTIAPRLILSGDLMTMTWGLSHPLPAGSQFYGGTLCQSTWGVGLTYYFMPVNIFISGTVGLVTFSLEKDNQSDDTDAGLGLYFKVGKEWWVGADWALGAAVSAGWGSTETNTTVGNEKLSGYSIGIHFNATYN